MFDVVTTIHLYLVNNFKIDGPRSKLSKTQLQYISLYDDVKDYQMYKKYDSEGDGIFKHYPGVCPENPLTFDDFLANVVKSNDALYVLK
jgi:hypothetical protein